MTTPQPDTFKTMFDGLDRRLRALETAPRLKHSSIRNGTLRLLDAAGLTRLFVGSVNSVEASPGDQPDAPPDLYGITMRDDSGGYCLEIAGSGFGLPNLPLPFYAQQGTVAGQHYIDVTSATFVPVYRGEVALLMWDAIRAGIDCSCDVATTGELRIVNDVVGGAASAVVPLPAGVSTSKEFRWLHQQPLFTGPFRPTLEVRRVSGAGAVYVYPPTVTELCSERWSGSTTTG